MEAVIKSSQNLANTEKIKVKQKENKKWRKSL